MAASKPPKAKPLFSDPALQALYINLGLDKAANRGSGRSANPYASINKYEIPKYVAADVIAEKTIKAGKRLSPELALLAQQIERQKQYAKMAGGKNSKTHSKSLLERTIDVLSRGEFAAANAFQDNIEEGKKKKGSPLSARRLGAGFKGFWEGLSGQEKTTYGDLRRDAGIDRGGKKNFTQDTTLSILGDPLTYTPFGLLGKGLRVAGRGATKGAREAKAAEEIVRKANDVDLKWARSVEESWNPATAGRVGVSMTPQQAVAATSIDVRSGRNAAPVRNNDPRISPAKGQLDEAPLPGSASQTASPATQVGKALTKRQKAEQARLVETRANAVYHFERAAKAGAVVPGMRGVPVPYSFENRAFIPETPITSAVENMPYRRADQIPTEAKQALKDEISSDIASAMEKATGKPPSEQKVLSSPEYRKRYQEELQKLVAAGPNPYKKLSRLDADEAFPISGVDDVHPSVRIAAEDHIIAEVDKLAERPLRNTIGVAAPGKVERTGKPYFHELPPAEQLTLMQNGKAKAIEKILEAQRRDGLLDEAGMPLSADVINQARAAETAIKGADPVEVARVDDFISASNGGKVKEPKKPRGSLKSSVGSKAVKSSDEKARARAQRPLEASDEAILAKVTDDLAKDIRGEFGPGKPAGTTAIKALTQLSEIINKLADAKQATGSTLSRKSYMNQPGTIYRAYHILQKAMDDALAVTGKEGFTHPATGDLLDIGGMLNKIPADQYLKITTIQGLLDFDPRILSDIAENAVEGVATAIKSGTLTRTAGDEMADAVSEGVEQAAKAAGSPDIAARVTGQEAGRAVQKAKVADEVDEASRDIGEATSKLDEDGYTPEALKRLEDLRIAQQVKVYQYIGIKLHVGLKNPILEIPLIRIGEKGARQLKQIERATKLAESTAKADRNYNSIIQAVTQGGRALNLMFNNSYGMTASIHAVKQTHMGNIATRLAEEANSISNLTNGVKSVDRTSAFLKARNGESFTVASKYGPEYDLGKAYGDYMDHIIGTAPGSVRNNAGLLPADILAELQYLRPRPGFPPLQLGDDLDWRTLDPQKLGLDPNHIAMTISAAISRAVITKHTISQLKAVHGVPRSGQLAQAARSGASKPDITPPGFAKVKHPAFERYVFPVEVAPQIDRMFDILDEVKKSGLSGIHPMIRLYDLLLGKWKAGVTIYNPAFHLRNLMGDIFMGYLDGVGPKAYVKSAKVLSYKTVRDGEELEPWMITSTGLDRRVIFDNFDPNRVIRSERDAAVEVGRNNVTNIKGHTITSEMYMQQYLNRGIKQNIASSEMLAVDELATQRVTQRLSSKIRDASEKREDFGRMAHFIHATERELRKGKTPEQAFELAARATKKFHADYTDLTPFEQKVMRRVVPFYTWQRRTMPVLLEAMLTNPAKMTVYPKIMRELSIQRNDDDPSFPNVDAIIPEWMRDNMMWPIYKHGQNQVFMDPSNPFNDMFKSNLNGLGEGQPFKTFAQQVTPFARMPVELSTGRQFFGSGDGIPIDNKANYVDTQIPFVNILSRISNISPSKTITDATNGEFGLARNPKVPNEGDEAGINNIALLNTLFATGSAENTQRRQRGELRRQQDFAAVDKKKAREEYYKKIGLPVPKNTGGR